MTGDGCSLVVLCVGAIASLSAIASISIGTTTDYWTSTHVDRKSVYEHGEGNNTGYMYFTRRRGLFRTCFPTSERPPENTPNLFLSNLEDWCYPREYYLSELLKGRMRPAANLSDPAYTQLQLQRVTPILLFAYLFSMILIGILGLCGCWQQSANKLITTAGLQLLAALVGASAMATWHAALFFEMEKVHDQGFPLSWPEWLQESTSVETSWSYILTWVGVCLTLLSSLTTSASAICLRSKRRNWEDNTMRMKLKMARLFAQHAYFPTNTRPSSRATTDRDYPTMQANFPTHRIPHKPEDMHDAYRSPVDQQFYRYN